MKCHALLFGINYNGDESLKLNGCINDVIHMANLLQHRWGFTTDICTDTHQSQYITAMGIMRKLYEIAVKSYKDSLDVIWIHYSGHGTYMKDKNGDEKDGRDECLVPIDCAKSGVIPDDFISHFIRMINPMTKVITVFDCCHSGTMGDLPLNWMNFWNVNIENRHFNIPCQILSFSGCLDTQTAAEAHNITGSNKQEGAFTASLLMAMSNTSITNYNVFELLEDVRVRLKQHNFNQIPKLSSSYNIRRSPMLF